MHNAMRTSVVYDALAVPSDLSHVAESNCDPQLSRQRSKRLCESVPLNALEKRGRGSLALLVRRRLRHGWNRAL